LFFLKFVELSSLNFKMILVLGSHSQVRTLQERQVPKALKILALERVRIILSCLTIPFFGRQKQAVFCTALTSYRQETARIFGGVAYLHAGTC
jgi:hypothetical protein